MVLALNMMDEVTANGGTVDVNALEAALGIPVVPISAAKNEGMGELAEHALHVARYREHPGRSTSARRTAPDGGALHRCIHGICHLIDDHAQAAGIPVRFAATKLIEGDRLVTQALALDQNELDAVEHIICQMEEESGTDRIAALADMRFSFIEGVCDALRGQAAREPRAPALCCRRPHPHRQVHRHTGVHPHHGARVLAHLRRHRAAPVGSARTGDRGLHRRGRQRSPLRRQPGGARLVIDGIFAGVGSVLSFLPIIVVLFFCCPSWRTPGYMARVAFVMDKLLRKHRPVGRSIVPMLIGFGCSVPAIMATRTLPSEHDRKMTVMLTPFMSCSAKLPVYGLFSAAFFPGLRRW